MPRSIEWTSRWTWKGWMVLLGLAASISGCASGPDTRPAATETRTEDGFVISETARVGLGVRSDFDRAVRALDDKDYDKAIELLLQVVEADPRLASAQIDLGIAYARAGKFDAAEKSLKAALAANPRHPVALNELAMVYRRTGRFAEARASYEAALELHPNFHFVQLNLGILCDLYLSDLDCALEHYEKYLSAVPDDDTAKIWINDLRSRAAK